MFKKLELSKKGEDYFSELSFFSILSKCCMTALLAKYVPSAEPTPIAIALTTVLKRSFAVGKSIWLPCLVEDCVETETADS